MVDVGITEADLTILRDTNLFNRITVDEFNKTIVDERAARRAIFLSLCSCWVKNLQGLPNVLVNSESSAGKSYITKQIIKIFPKEMVEYRTKISPEAFTYWHNPQFEPDWNWDGKILYLEDTSQKILDSDTFKVMCSEGSTATVVIKQRAYDIEIKGKPVMILTTANTNPNNEVLNRYTIITLTETPEQTAKILQGQAKKACQTEQEKYDLTLIHALRALRRVEVNVPFAESLVDTFPKEQLRVRRDFPRFLDFIRASAAFHQYQRENQGNVVIANKQDLDLALEVFNSINTSEVFGLTKKLKTAYDNCLAYSREKGAFTAKDIYCNFPFVSEKSWYGILDDLAKLGLIEITLDKKEGSDKKVMYFHPKSLKKTTTVVQKGIEGNEAIVVNSWEKFIPIHDSRLQLLQMVQMQKGFHSLIDEALNNLYLLQEGGDDMEVNDIYSGGQYLKATDVQKPVTVTILEVSLEDFTKKGKDGVEELQKKIVLTFDDVDKKFVLNKTNAVAIGDILGSTNTDSWIGQKIKLWKSKTQFQGNMVDCIAVSPA